MCNGTPFTIIKVFRLRQGSNQRPLHQQVTVGNHVTFCTYLRTERVRKLIIVSLILNEFSCGKMQVLKSRFQARCIFPHKLEQRMKVFARAYVEKCFA